METYIFHPLWDKNKDRLKAFIRTKVKTMAEAEDILQDVYLKSYHHFASLQQEDKFTSWVYSITRNQLNKHFQESNKFTQTQDIEVFAGTDAAQEGIESKNLQDLALQFRQRIGEIENVSSLDLETVKKMFQGFDCVDFTDLPLVYIDAWLECDVKEIPQKEYAEKRGISLSAAKSRVQRAREKIRMLFMACCDFEFDVRGHIVNYTPIHKEQKCLINEAC